MWGFGQMNIPDPNLMTGNGIPSSTGHQDANSSQQMNVPAGYTLVPMAYLQQMQMTISQMYSQISALTTAQNALQQAFQTFTAQRNPMPLNQGANLAELINELKADKQKAVFKSRGNLERPRQNGGKNRRNSKQKRPENKKKQAKPIPFDELKVYDFSIEK